MDPSRLGPPIDVRPLLGRERESLIEVLEALGVDDWQTPSPCPEWSVHGHAVHLVHDDLRRLSADRDGHCGGWVASSSFDELVVAFAKANEAWVGAVTPSLSPRLTCDMLAWLAAPSEAHLASLTPDALAATVSWAGPGPHPNWLDVAREFTERWVHQQQIRQAVGRPGCDEPAYLDAVVDTVVRGAPAVLPHRPPGTQVQVRVTAPLQREWTLAATTDGWGFIPAAPSAPEAAAAVELSPTTMWQRAVRMLSREQVHAQVHATGDPELVGLAPRHNRCNRARRGRAVAAGTGSLRGVRRLHKSCAPAGGPHLWWDIPLFQCR